MRISMKLVVWLWIGLLAIMGGLFYGAYSKLNPQSFVSLLNEQVQKNYPGSKLTVKSIDYGFALDFTLDLKELVLTRGNQKLGTVGQVELKIPWWVLLFNRGSAQINISRLDIYIDSSTPVEIKEKTTSSQPKVVVHVPDYMSDAKYTLRAKNISIREINGDRRFFHLSKLLVREFQYGKNSAFELNIPISINLKEKKYISDLWLFGDVTPDMKKWNLNFRGEFRTKGMAEGFEFDDLVIDGKAEFNPTQIDFNSAVDISIDSKVIGNGVITGQQSSLNVDLKFASFPLDYLTFAGDEIKNPFWPNKADKAEGSFTFTRDFNVEPGLNLIGKLQFPGAFVIGNDNSTQGKWQLNFENDKWETSFITPKGDVSFARRAAINFAEGKVTQFSQEIGFVGCDLRLALATIEPLGRLMDVEQKIYYSSFVSFKKCLSGEETVDGIFRYGISPFQTFYQSELTKAKERFVLNYQQKSLSHQLSAEFVDFEWKPEFQFLNQFFATSSGVFKGKIDGKWNEHWSDGTWALKLKASNLKDESGEFFNLGQSALTLFGLESINRPQQDWNINISKNVITVNSYTIENEDPILLKGSLSNTTKQKSFLTLTYPKNKKWRPVRKDILSPFWKKESP